MTQVNAASALAFLQEMSDCLEANKGASGEAMRSTHVEIQKRLLALRRLTERVAPSLVEKVRPDGMGLGFDWYGLQDVIDQLTGVLEQEERLEAMLGPVGPSIAASQLHPSVWNASAALFDDGHFRAAVQKAAASV